MRPHRLTMTAFGPFAGTVVVDLDALSAAGLFLLHGETGAGKTTLLDGLGFALFGRVPGERGRAKRLRSDHAQSTARTSVELEVTLHGRRLRIQRTPQQDRASSRGGTTVAPAKVQLDEWIGGRWSTVSTRVGEADSEIAELMGMSAEQFFQVVLLPQGEFAKFLRADSEERGRLLQRLFGTDRYRAVEDWLADQRRLAAARVEAGQQQAQVLAARFAQVAGAPQPDELTGDWAAGLLTDVQERAAAAGERLAAARADAERADAAGHAAVALGARQERRRHALTRQTVITADHGAIRELRRELAAAARADQLAPLLSDCSRRRAAVAAGRQALERLPGLGPGPLEDLLDRERRAVGRLEGLQEVAASLRTEVASAVAAAAEAEVAGAVAAAATIGLTALPPRRRELERALRGARAAAAELPAAQACQLAVRRAAEDAAALAAADEAGLLHRDELTLAREGAVALQEKAVDIREARVDSMIAELAATLDEGSPCPVCGAIDHPDPSLLRGARVTRDDEDRAQNAYELARRDVEQAASRLAAADAVAGELRDRLAEAGFGGRPAVELGDEAAALAVEVAALVERAEQVPVCERELAALVEQEAELVVAKAQGESDQTGALRRRGEATARADRARGQLAAQLDGAADLASALDRAHAVVAAAEEVQRVRAALAVAECELQASEERLAAATAGAGFASPALAEQALRDEDWHAATAERVTAHDTERVAVSALLADPDLDVPLEPPAPIAETAAALAAARGCHDDAARDSATAGAAAEAAAQLAPQLWQSLRELEPLQRRATEVRRLADLASGTSSSNTLRMSLSSFVLAARLEEVALAASERLLRMTQGRYSLVHTDLGRGGGRSGLGLLARDTWTGRDRETSTLSGGETFLASLALALGLADVVAAEAGGSRIEALFVDEGFGTLDEDTLDEVMDVLDGLREGGRVVGLVSHVAELRQRIPAQVHVRKGRTGSELTVLGC